MTDLILLTGFLGSGKTTLMQGILNEYNDERTGVIVNEFGSVNIDAVLLEKEGVKMAELSNGSIFCACIKDKFVDSLIDMSHRNLDHLFIEASGLADPSNMEGIISGIAHKTNNGYAYRGSICIIDAENFPELSQVLPAIGSQLEYCSAVIVNKTDLVSSEQLEEVRKGIREFNKNVKIYPTTYCRVDIHEIIDGLGMKVTLPDSRETGNNMNNRAATFVIRGDSEVEYDRLEAFLQDVVGDSYRIKGFANTDRGPVEVSTVGSNIQINEWNKKIEKNEIVLISAIGLKMMSTITKALAEHLKGVMNIC